MTDVAALLVQSKVSRALIIDDAYDEVPLAMDLAMDAEEWTHFFEDLRDDDTTVLRELYPGYDDVRGDELQGDDKFVVALWQGSGRRVDRSSFGALPPRVRNGSRLSRRA